MTLNVTSKLVSELATSVKRQFGDESGVQITDADIIRWVNDGQREINLKNRVVKAKATTDVVAGKADYSLPTQDASIIESIHYDGVPLTATPYAEVENYITSFKSGDSSGTPEIWYEWASVITLWPTPSANLVGGLVILYTAGVPIATALTDTLGLPDKYYNTLVRYVMSQALELDENWDAASYKTKQVVSDLDNIADEERSTSNMTYPTIIVGVDY